MAIVPLDHYRSAPDPAGIYHLGPDANYVLAPAALKHIIDGDFGERIVRDQNGKFSHNEPILKGGLHTATAWTEFKKTWHEMTHGVCFLSSRDKFWYFARELSNNVILLKIPKQLFQSGAAKLTRFADFYYKSGFLWKTLFPMELSDAEIIAVINEALHNLDKEESTNEILIGYARLQSQSTAMSVRIQVIGKEIHSAFPTWSQPNYGNNGKPFTHFDSISFQLAESTEFFDCWEEHGKSQKNSALGAEQLTYDELVEFTPEILLERPVFSSEKIRTKWNDKIKKYAVEATDADLEKINTYLLDWAILKESYSLSLALYNAYFSEWKSKKHITNIFSIIQNTVDCLAILEERDVSTGSVLAENFIFTFIDSKFVRTGGLDLWETKRIYSRFFRYVTRRNDCTLSWKFLRHLCNSPNRTGAYFDFDLNVFYPHDQAVIGVTDPDVRVQLKHFYRFAANQMGPSYFRYWGIEDREKLARKMQQSFGKNSNVFLPNSVQNSHATEFTSFAFNMLELMPSLMLDNSNFDGECLELIYYDYYRLCIQSVHRFTADNLKIMSEGRELEFDPTPGSSYAIYNKTKHERMFIEFGLRRFTEKYSEICVSAGRPELAEKANERIETFYKQRPPHPRKIPDYIASWQQEHVAKSHKIEELIDVMLGES